MKKLILAAITTAAFALPAQARTVTYDFAAVEVITFGEAADGTIVDIAGSFDGLTGQIVFDTTPSDPVADFFDPDAGFFGPGQITFDQFDVESFGLSPRQLVISNDFQGTDSVSLITPVIPSTDTFSQVSFILSSLDGSALSSAELPGLLSLDDYEGASLFLNYIDNVSGNAELSRYDLTELTLAPIPLPAGGLLLLGGLVGLGMIRRRG